MIIFGKKIFACKKGTRGTALIEFALAAPLLLLVLTAGYQAFQYVALNVRLNTIASKVASWTSADVTSANIQDCFIGAWLLDQVDNFASNGQIVVTGISASSTGQNPVRAWQVASSGAASSIVVGSHNAITSAPFALAPEAQLIVVEVKYSYTPFFSSLSSIFPAITLYKVAQTMPQNTAQFNSFS